jgi:two-component system response regulator AtoC
VSQGAVEILGRSEAIFALRRELPKIARSDAPALITGETGTGKEHFARSIHRQSRRSSKPFVAINCAAIPDTLFESELFGFERGSFTGAVASRPGKAKLADGGTLFLDEIGDLSTYNQTKLLRLLEEKEAYPIGATEPVKIDLRVIAATNVDVEDAVSAGRFRSDLYYRINVARIDIPSLADRPEDIRLYVDHFIESFNRDRHTLVRGIDPEVLDLLVDYDWPGNVREVRNFVEAVFIDPPAGPITMRNIPNAFAHLRHSYSHTGPGECERMLAALEQTNWNKAKAAETLHWSRMTLYRKLTKYNVSQSTAAGHRRSGRDGEV